LSTELVREAVEDTEADLAAEDKADSLKADTEADPAVADTADNLDYRAAVAERADTDYRKAAVDSNWVAAVFASAFYCETGKLAQCQR
jgi:hypothetical protein